MTTCACGQPARHYAHREHICHRCWAIEIWLYRQQGLCKMLGLHHGEHEAKRAALGAGGPAQAWMEQPENQSLLLR